MRKMLQNYFSYLFSWNRDQGKQLLLFWLGLLLCLLNSFSVWAQNPNTDQIASIRNIIPPSPNASALGRFGEVPVGHSTGVPNISIPLYELVSGSIKLPVNLSYHAGGFKVNENASWVGLGWALQAGGTISRSRIGYADEKGRGYLESGTYLGSLTFPINYTMNSSQYAIYESLAYGQFDTEPDIFNFSFLGRSGRFFLDANGNVHQLNYTDLKISVNSAFTEWTIVDEAGTIYTFAAMGDTYVQGDLFPDFTSSWDLTRIQSVNNDVINFIYGTANASGGAALNVGFSQVKYDPSPLNITCDIVPSGSNRYSVSISSSPVLTAIEADNFTLKFNTSFTARLDGGSALDNMELYDKSNKLVKKYQLLFDYFDGNGCSASGLGHEHNDDKIKKRLKLLSLSEISSGVEKKHQFYYDQTALPYKCSYEQDHWGYYNGKPNTNLIPNITGYPWETSAANREADSLYAKAGILNKISYPTGGSTVFDYESNKILSTLQVPQLKVVSDGLYNAAGGTESIQEFTVVASSNSATITLQLSDMGYPGGNILPEIQIINSSNVIVHQWMNNGSYTNLPIYLVPGTYKLKLISPDVPESIVSAAIQYTGFQAQTGDRAVGGLRVRSITDYDSNGSTVSSKRNYVYENGYLANDFLTNDDYRTNTSLNQFHDCGPDPNSNLRCDFLGRASYASYSLGTMAGGHIVYRKVHELTPGNGKTVFEFSIFPVTIPTGFPQAPASLNDWKSGQLLKKTVYAQNNSLVKKDTYEFDYLEKFRLVNYKIGFVYDNYCHSALSNTGHLFDQISAIGFENLSGLVRLNNHKEVTYASTGLDSVQVSTNYYYDNPAYVHSNRSEMINSKGELIKTISRYPQDVISGLTTLASTAKSNLVTQYRIKELLEQETYNNSSLVSKLRVNYSNQWANSSLTLPHLVERQYGAGAMENIIRNYDYDDRGNLLTQSKEKGPLMSYLWGYHKQYPVAEVLGSDYSGISSLVNMSVVNNPATELQLRTELDKIRLAFASSSTQVSSYTYEPLVGMKSQTDAKGMTTYYTYDNFGRLENIKDLNEDIVKNYKYHYGNGNTPPSGGSYPNQEFVITRTKNNCTSGTGSTINYTVPQGTYTSTIDEADARVHAEALVSAAAQAEANALGTCSASPAGIPNEVFVITRTKNNCGPGLVGSTINYTVPKGTYTSSISEADARIHAEALVSAAAQTEANTLGTCGNEPTVTYTNSELNVPILKNCPEGQTSTLVFYNVPAGKYTSIISLDDANQMAWDEITNNGQAYADQNGGCTVNPIVTYKNTLLKVNRTKNNCSAGLVGTVVEYVVPANRYSSTISQADANQQAQADADNNAQDNANNNGNCILAQFNIVYSFPTGQHFNVKVVYTNNTQNLYQFLSGSGTIPNIAGGTGQIFITSVNGNKYEFKLNGNANPIISSSVVFGSLPFTGNMQLGATLAYGNSQLTIAKTRNNCTVEQVGTSVNYLVAANSYFSVISQADANQVARSAEDANAQAKANLNGKCNPAPVFYSHYISSSYARNNCAVGMLGSTVAYTVLAGKYTSLISQADANQKAQDDIIANGQNNANTLGTCQIPRPTFSLTYTLPVGREFKVSIYDTVTSELLEYVLTGEGMLFGIPGGTCNVSINEVNNVDSFYITFNYQQVYGYEASFSNVLLDGNLVSLEVVE